MKTQPGVMLYFDVRDSIAQLSYEEKGRLLDAILDYGQHRQEPMFDGVALPLIWPFVRKDIHRDSERYKERQAAGKKGAQHRWGETEEVSDSKPIANDSKDMANMPTTSTPSSPAAAAPSTAAAAAETPSPTPAASALPRTNGSNLPDIVAQYLPARRNTPEDIERRRAEAIARLRAMPDN